jgi:signal transduction histidine kinase
MLFYIATLFAIGCAGLAFWSRRSGSRSLAIWLFCLGLLGLAADNMLLGFSQAAVVDEELEFLQRVRLGGISFIGITWLLFSLTFSRGNSVQHLKRWRLPLSGFVLAALVMAWLSGTLIEKVEWQAGQEWMVSLAGPGRACILLFLVLGCLTLMNLEQTFRAAVGTTRWRIKYMVFGIGLLFGAQIFTSSQGLLYSAIVSNWQMLNAAALIVACLLVGVSLWRERAFEVDIYPSSAVLQRSVTILLVGIYFLVVGVLAHVASAFAWDHYFPLKPFLLMVALAGLAVLLFSDRVQQRTKFFVSRHFRRPVYDSRKVWSAVTEKTASLAGETDFCRAVVQVVSETFNALSVTIWLKKEDRLMVAASTVLTRGEAQEQPENWLGELEKQLARAAGRTDQDSTGEQTSQSPGLYPMVFESFEGAGAEGFSRLNASRFKHGGKRVLAPLGAQEQLLGVMVLGDRVNGVPFSPEEFDLLKCISDQVGANLHRIQLSQQLLEAKELEAFQTMSAFFVHDLKNTSTSLSLMLKNLRIHFDDPDFREDALQAVSRSVNRINQMIQQLTLFRQQAEPRLVETDLNALVESTLAGLNGGLGIELKLEGGIIPKVQIDPEQVQKVITNLVLNAKDATGGKGPIKVQTSRANGCAVISVQDNGCGMTPEFIRKSLFRPFQTTKKSGIGIGIFHCKSILEAHGGKIEVQSEPGKGTTFRVMFPASS